MRNTKESAKILVRRGREAELPTLSEGEFGFTLDTNRLFIGNPTHPSCEARDKSNTFPYGNVEIMTSESDISDFLAYNYVSNNENKTYMPIIIKGTSSIYQVQAGLVFALSNGVDEVSINVATSYDSATSFVDFVNTRLALGSFNARFIVNDDKTLTLICLYKNIIIKNVSGNFLGIWGVSSKEGSHSAEAIQLPERSVQEKLDDNFHIKDFGVEGHGKSDESEFIRNAIYDIYNSNQKPEYYRGIYFPAGRYLIKSKLPLFRNMYIYGEGIDRTVILASSDMKESLFDSCDLSYLYSSETNYGVEDNTPKNILIRDLSIDASQITSVLNVVIRLSKVDNITFENVKFVGNDRIVSFVSDYSDNTHITFNGCVFETADNGILLSKNNSFVTIKNCFFENCGNAINYSTESGKTIYGSIICGNTFRNCGVGSDSVISINQNNGLVEYVSITQNIFDKNIIERTGNILPVNVGYNKSGHNFVDVLDPNENTKKLLSFRFTQPEWKFIDYLTSQYGDIITAEYDGNAIKNHLVVKGGTENNDDVLTIKTSSMGGLNLGVADSASIGLGVETSTSDEWQEGIDYSLNKVVKYNEKYYVCILANTSSNTNNPKNQTYWKEIAANINLFKPLNLNGKTIIDNSGNITLETHKDSYVSIKYNDTEKSYEDLIKDYDDAVPTTKFVKSIANPFVKKHLSYENIQQNQVDTETPIAGIIPFYNMKQSQCKYVSLNEINVNVRKPFFPMVSYLNASKLSTWEVGLNVKAGNIVYVLEGSITRYLACVTDHITSQSYGYEETQPSWNDEVQYKVGNVVNSNNVWYECIQDSLNNEPASSTSYWKQTDKVSKQLWVEVFTSATDTSTQTNITLTDVKYAGILASSSSGDILLNKPEKFDISKDNETDYPEVVLEKAYSENDKVMYQGYVYTAQSAQTVQSYSDLFNITKWKPNNDIEGNNYTIKFDTNVYELVNGNISNVVDSASVDWYNHKLKLALYDNNMNLIPIVSKYDLKYFQINPLGDIIITLSTSLNDMEDIRVSQ